MRSQLLMGKRVGVPAGLGLPRPAHRAAGREDPGQGRPGAGFGRVPRALRGARAEVRRRHADGVQAPRLRRALGGSLPDAGEGLRGDHRAPAGRVRGAGLVYRDKKPVHWCFVHRTALAEAEVEYEDHASPSIYVRFPIAGDVGKADPRLRDQRAAFVIWTTTPWTLPANLAVVANPELDYVAIPRDGEYLIVAAGLAEALPRRDRHRRAEGDVDRASRATACGSWRARVHAALPASERGRASATTASGSRVTRRSRQARAWCTPRPDTAQRTTSSGASMAWRSSRPSMSTATARRGELDLTRWTGKRVVRRQPRRSSTTWPAPACC